ncbi:MAG: type IV pilus assembly protein PilM [Candidatus Doudnabacteria bacterium]|nr:type IV pilus assembly protein PilM [Candidatus Doudnabacteria bacterium]
MSIFGNKNSTAFGLDISDSSIKVAELKISHGRLHSAVFADVPLLDKTISNHLIINEERLAGNILKALQTAKNIKTKYVICSVPEAKSFVRILHIPSMSSSEIETAIPYELEQDIPIPIDQVYLDWQILKETPSGLELLVTASSKDYIDSLVSSLHSVKLKPIAMEIGSQATARALVGAEFVQKSVLIVDIGAQQTSFIIVDQNIPLYTSSVPIAGNAFTESVARTMNIPVHEAEKIKVSRGLTSQGEKEEGIRQAILPILDNVIDEVKNVIRFFEEHSDQHHLIDTILLCGGSSRVPGFIEYISTRINLGSVKNPLKVLQGDPWSTIMPNFTNRPLPLNHEEALGYATAIGLAIRGNNNETD